MPDQGWCDGVIVFRVQRGASDGVNLGGRTVVVTADFPGPNFFDGNATARLCIDQAANPAQRRELEAIFQGKKGGPWEAVGALVTKWLPTQASRIDIQQDGDTLTATVGNVGQVKSQSMKDPEGHPTTLRHAGLAAGLKMETVELAPSTGTQISDRELPRRIETKSGVVGNITWSA